MSQNTSISHSSWHKHLRNIIIVLLIVLIFSQFISTSIAQEGGEGNEGEGGIARNFGWVSVGLVVISLLYVLFYKSFIISRKIFPKKILFFKGIRDFIRDIFIKVRKPLLVLHYVGGIAALIFLFIHGLTILGYEAQSTILIGWITAYIYLYYVITGILIKTVFRKVKKYIKLKRFLTKLHNNLIFLIIIGLIHIAHLASVGD